MAAGALIVGALAPRHAAEARKQEPEPAPNRLLPAEERIARVATPPPKHAIRKLAPALRTAPAPPTPALATLALTVIAEQTARERKFRLPALL